MGHTSSQGLFLRLCLTFSGFWLVHFPLQLLRRLWTRRLSRASRLWCPMCSYLLHGAICCSVPTTDWGQGSIPVWYQSSVQHECSFVLSEPSFPNTQTTFSPEKGIFSQLHDFLIDFSAVVSFLQMCLSSLIKVCVCARVMCIQNIFLFGSRWNTVIVCDVVVHFCWFTCWSSVLRTMNNMTMTQQTMNILVRGSFISYLGLHQHSFRPDHWLMITVLDRQWMTRDDDPSVCPIGML